MPKTYNNLWKQICSWENLHSAFIEARKGKKFKNEALRFGSRLEENLTNIHNHLIWKSWRPGPWREFWHTDPKVRFIQAPPFQDRIVHHALVDVIQPYFVRKFIHDSNACIAGRGTHAAMGRVNEMLRRTSRSWSRTYVLKADISRYFPSISHDILMRILSRTIRDKDVLWLCDTIIRQNESPRGIPVGFLTSQLFANVYLDQLDHCMKDAWGVKNYVRYMDDFVVLGSSKKELWDMLEMIQDFLAMKLALSLNPKTAIYPARKGVDFAGYRIWPTHILPRKRNLKRARKTFKSLSRAYAEGKIGLEYIKPRLASFLGYTKHCSSWRSTESVLNDLVLQRQN